MLGTAHHDLNSKGYTLSGQRQTGASRYSCGSTSQTSCTGSSRPRRQPRQQRLQWAPSARQRPPRRTPRASRRGPLPQPRLRPRRQPTRRQRLNTVQRPTRRQQLQLPRRWHLQQVTTGSRLQDISTLDMHTQDTGSQGTQPIATPSIRLRKSAMGGHCFKRVATSTGHVGCGLYRGSVQ